MTTFMLNNSNLYVSKIKVITLTLIDDKISGWSVSIDTTLKLNMHTYNTYVKRNK